MINKTTKRLLTASRLGISFDYGNGHRWISFNEETMNDFPLGEQLQKGGIFPNTKIYGNIIDALNYVDYILELVGQDTLEKQFDSYNDWGFDNENVKHWEDSGEESRKYFKERIIIRK